MRGVEVAQEIHISDLTHCAGLPSKMDCVVILDGSLVIVCTLVGVTMELVTLHRDSSEMGDLNWILHIFILPSPDCLNGKKHGLSLA